MDITSPKVLFLCQTFGETLLFPRFLRTLHSNLQYRGMMHDPALYHDPLAFKPERFLGVDGQETETDPHIFVFGFGRRVCPGRILADTTVWLSVAKSLAVFQISKPVENGVEVDLKAEFQPGVISHPVPCKLQVVPRSAPHEKLILAVEQEHPWEQGDGSELDKIRF